MPDPVMDARRRSAAWRALAAALNVPVVPALAGNVDYLELLVLERLAGLLATPEGLRFLGPLVKATPSATPAEPAPAVHRMNEYIAPPEPAKA